MKPNPVATPRDPSNAEIQRAAYLLWLDSGRPEAHDCDLWFAAEEMLNHRRVDHACTLQCMLEGVLPQARRPGVEISTDRARHSPPVEASSSANVDRQVSADTDLVEVMGRREQLTRSK